MSKLYFSDACRLMVVKGSAETAALAATALSASTWKERQSAYNEAARQFVGDEGADTTEQDREVVAKYIMPIGREPRETQP